MDLFAICQGFGLALAAGLIIGVVVPPIMPTWGLIAGAAPLGVIACMAALGGADEAVWPGVPVGIAGAALASAASRDVAAGATRRAQDQLDPRAQQAPPGVVFMIAVTAVLIAVLSIFLPPVSLAVGLALVWLLLSRRRREQRKHEGLRVLR